MRFSDDRAVGDVTIERDDQGLAAGQFAVFYDENTCLGCGVILEKKMDESLQARDAAHRNLIEGGVRRLAEERRAKAKAS
jgi:tRNA-specific 2-thiouridylase